MTARSKHLYLMASSLRIDRNSRHVMKPGLLTKSVKSARLRESILGRFDSGA
jgi:hypothetical protein